MKNRLPSLLVLTLILTLAFSHILVAQDSLSVLKFSHTGGFYKTGFQLELKTLASAENIYYTLDGSKPGTFSLRYTEPISIQSKQGVPNDISNIRTNHYDNELSLIHI